jgi:hypothetical protein
MSDEQFIELLRLAIDEAFIGYSAKGGETTGNREALTLDGDLDLAALARVLRERLYGRPITYAGWARHALA